MKETGVIQDPRTGYSISELELVRMSTNERNRVSLSRVTVHFRGAGRYDVFEISD